MKRKFWIALLSILLTITLASMIYVGILSLQEEYSWAASLPFKSWFNQKNVYQETKTFTDTIPLKNNLTIENLVGDISIIGKDTEEITITADFLVTSNDSERVKLLLDQAELLLSDQSSTSIAALVPPLKNEEQVAIDLTLVVPEEIIGNINVGQGDIRAEALTGDLKLKTSIGNITVADFIGNAIFNSDSGEINLKNSYFTDELQVYAGLGDVFIQGELAKQTTLELNLGDLSIQLPENIGYNIVASYPAGTFYTDLPLSGQRTDTEVEGIIGAAQDNQLFINVELGSINIKYFKEE